MPETNDPLAVARPYATAYASFDASELLDVLAPSLRLRHVNPSGYLELHSAHAYVDATRQFLDTYDTYRSVGASAEAMGDRILTTSRITTHQDAPAVPHAALGDRHSRRRQSVEINGVCTGAVIAPLGPDLYPGAAILPNDEHPGQKG